MRYPPFILAVLATTAACHPGTAPRPRAGYDVVITGGRIVDGILSAIAFQAQIGRMQQILGVRAVTGASRDLPQQIAPKLPTDRNVGHVSAPVIFPPGPHTIKRRPIIATKIFSEKKMG